MKIARKSGEVLRGVIIGALLLLVMVELAMLDGGATVFRYQGF
jgi:hypothetical protein